MIRMEKSIRHKSELNSGLHGVYFIFSVSALKLNLYTAYLNNHVFMLNLYLFILLLFTVTCKPEICK